MIWGGRNYCTLGSNALIVFAFDTYDCDSSGTICKDEMKIMLKEIYGADFDSNGLAHVSVVSTPLAVPSVGVATVHKVFHLCVPRTAHSQKSRP